MNNNKSLKSKILKTRVMLGSSRLAGHIPPTRLLNRQSLHAMLEHYGIVYAKPDKGSQGKGVLRIEKTKKGYRCQNGLAVSHFNDYASLYRSIEKHAAQTPYVVQKGIHLLRHNHRPFDFRVMIQRNLKRKWECTGTFGRLAHPGKAVTNGSQGGTIYDPLILLSKFGSKHETREMQKQMNQLAYLTAYRLSSVYPTLNEFGLDICFDQNLKPWILEVNTIPDPSPFTLLPKFKGLSKIVSYGKAYGKRYKLTCTKAKRAPAR